MLQQSTNKTDKNSKNYKSKPINFRKEYWYVYEHLMKQGNASRYVIDLIIADMNKEKRNDVVRKRETNNYCEDILAGANDLIG